MKIAFLTSFAVLLSSGTALAQEVVKVAPPAEATPDPAPPAASEAPPTKADAKQKKTSTKKSSASAAPPAPATAGAAAPASTATATAATDTAATGAAAADTATTTSAAPSVDPAAPASGEVSGPTAAAPEEPPVAAKAAKKTKKKKVKKIQPKPEELEVDAAEPEPSEPPPVEEPFVDPETQPFTHHLNRWELGLGGSVLWTSSTALDYFASNNILGRFEARVARTFALGDRLSFAVSPSWNVIGAADDGVRSNNSFLRFSEFSLGLELRYFLSTRLSGFVRLAPGGTHTLAELQSGAATLRHDSFNFHGDLSAGVAWRVVGHGNGEKKGLRLYWLFEGGYDWMPARSITLSAVQGSPERTRSFTIDGFELNAPHFGSSLLLTY